MPDIKLPDGSVKQYKESVTVANIASDIGEGLFRAALAGMVDKLQYFSMGYSWGGYESLILPFNADGVRSAQKWPYNNKTCLRINVGLEDLDDLKEDLVAGFGRLCKPEITKD